MHILQFDIYDRIAIIFSFSICYDIMPVFWHHVFPKVYFTKFLKKCLSFLSEVVFPKLSIQKFSILMKSRQYLSLLGALDQILVGNVSLRL